MYADLDKQITATFRVQQRGPVFKVPRRKRKARLRHRSAKRALLVCLVGFGLEVA